MTTRIVWAEVRARLAAMDQSPATRALGGEGPLYEAMLDERARALAELPPVQDQFRDDVLEMAGQSGRWALVVAAVARVEALGPCTPVPGTVAPTMGLVPVGGDRYLLVDADALGAGQAPPRPLDRPGHAVALRGGKVALAVDHALGIRQAVLPAVSGRLVRAVLDDGLVLLDETVVLARALGRGEL